MQNKFYWCSGDWGGTNNRQTDYENGNQGRQPGINLDNKKLLYSHFNLINIRFYYSAKLLKMSILTKNYKGVLLGRPHHCSHTCNLNL